MPRHIWFVSDWHVGHRKIATERGFASLEEMEEALVERHNQLVAPTDPVFFLGDAALCSRAHGERVLRRFNGRIQHILGNHDWGKAWMRDLWPGARDVLLLQQKGLPPIWLSHYAHSTWPKKHYGALHLFGHSHGRLARCEPHSMDVSVEAIGMEPIELDAVLQRIGRSS